MSKKKKKQITHAESVVLDSNNLLLIEPESKNGTDIGVDTIPDQTNTPLDDLQTDHNRFKPKIKLNPELADCLEGINKSRHELAERRSPYYLKPIEPWKPRIMSYDPDYIFHMMAERHFCGGVMFWVRDDRNVDENNTVYSYLCILDCIHLSIAKSGKVFFRVFFANSDINPQRRDYELYAHAWQSYAVKTPAQLLELVETSKEHRWFQNTEWDVADGWFMLVYKGVFSKIGLNEIVHYSADIERAMDRSERVAILIESILEGSREEQFIYDYCEENDLLDNLWYSVVNLSELDKLIQPYWDRWDWGQAERRRLYPGSDPFGEDELIAKSNKDTYLGEHLLTGKPFPLKVKRKPKKNY